MEEKNFLAEIKKNNGKIELAYKEVVIFGAGTVGKSVIFMLKVTGISVMHCFDNNPDKAGETLWDDVSCELPRLIDKDIPIVIAVEDAILKDEICCQCAELGYLYIYDIDLIQLQECIDELPDKEFLELHFFLRIGSHLNLENPKTFNEKLQWLKLYDRNPLYIRMTDKYEAKKYIAEVLGQEYIIPTLGIWNSFDEIDFANLPKQFVLKCTHDSGSVSVVLDKDKMDYKNLKEKYTKALHSNHYKIGREWPYKDIKPRIIAEKYIGEANKYKGELVDYKLMCFNGKVKCSFTCTGRFNGEDGLKVTFYDTEWKKMPFERHYPSEHQEIRKPDSYTEMVELAEQLTKNILFARIDFYEMDKHPYLGEITLYPGSGFEEFVPHEWDLKLGEWIKLPKKCLVNFNN